MTSSDDMTGPPALRIVRGDPTPEELAALTTVVGAAGGEDVESGPPERRLQGRWNDPRRAQRRYWPVGPDGWRTAR